MKIVTATPSQTEFSGENSVCDKPQLWAYVPYTLTKDNEQSNNGDRGHFLQWSSGAVFNVGASCTFEGKDYISKTAANTGNIPHCYPTGCSFKGCDVIPTASMISKITAANDILGADLTVLDDSNANTPVVFTADTYAFVPTGTTWAGYNWGFLYHVKEAITAKPVDIFPLEYQTSNVYFEWLGRPYASMTGSTVNSVRLVVDPTATVADYQCEYDKSRNRFYIAAQTLAVDAARSYPDPNVVLPVQYDTTNWDAYTSGTYKDAVYEPYPNVKTKKSSGNLVISWKVTQPFTSIGLHGITGESLELVINRVEADTSFTEIYNAEISLAKSEHPLYKSGEESYHKSLLVDHIPATVTDTHIVAITIKTATGTKDTLIGMVQPYNGVSLGLMNYAPVISTINTTGSTVGANQGAIKRKLSYKTLTPETALDDIVDALYFISRLSVEYSIPTLFLGAYPYDALRLLGHMPIYQQSLNNASSTSATLNIEEVTSPDKTLKVGIKTGTDESTPPPPDPDPDPDCVPTLFDYPMLKYTTTSNPFSYEMKKYAACP